ncbi:hypothetical protein GUJ93_ZPchr0005g14590 [Zizania palustris]|uniref:Uncharacterized protein n=1 Tax=Zizania palustris TaxID=103762 RepID=A0A8J5SXP1_ZIZPA|nr:hypothetical protein GUJ93_ZPchr0005g14590 [Zizania palustris]
MDRVTERPMDGLTCGRRRRLTGTVLQSGGMEERTRGERTGASCSSALCSCTAAKCQRSASPACLAACEALIPLRSQNETGPDRGDRATCMEDQRSRRGGARRAVLKSRDAGRPGPWPPSYDALRFHPPLPPGPRS